MAVGDFYQRGFGRTPLKTEADWRNVISNYWGLCSLVDTHVGRILDALEESGQADNTIVVFTSDHGDMMSSHRLLAKAVMFEEAVRVPLLIRMPGQRTQRRIAGPVSQVDLVPTLLDAMGCETPSHLQGKSLLPLLKGERDQATEDVFHADDRIVDQLSDGYRQASQRHGIDRHVKPLENQPCHHDRQRNGRERDKGGAEIQQKEE